MLPVKRNQPQSYEEIVSNLGEISEDYQRMKENPVFKPRHPEMMEGYGEMTCQEKNRDCYERRWYKICRYPLMLTKVQEEWPMIKTVGEVIQVRILIERDEKGNDITPDLETFLREGARRQSNPLKGDSENSDIQVTGIISDRELTEKEMGEIKRQHWAEENSLHHVLDETFREDRSPVKKSKIIWP